MNITANKLTGSIVWVHGPNPKRLPLMMYVSSIDGSMVECYMVHEEEFLATADDLVYGIEHHSHHLPLVIQPRLSAEIPISFLGQVVTSLSASSIQEIALMVNGIRRTADRTGILIRSEEEFRWDNVMFQKRHLDAVLDEINEQSDELLQADLVLLGAQQGDIAEIARQYLISLMKGGDWSLLNLTSSELQNLGLTSFAADFVAAAAAAAAKELLNQPKGEVVDQLIDESVIKSMETILQSARSKKETINV
jgi:hypothetical protein